MLLSLKVKNYALIDELHVEFHDKLNIITGETGAGKSILLGALGLILGKRADLNVLRSQDKKCVVEAEFDIKSYSLKVLFDSLDVDYEDHTVFRREILSSGKSRAFVNDTPVNLNVIQELALKLVDIHSQHQNLSLNKQGFLIGLIDRYCGNEKKVDEFSVSFETYKTQEEAYRHNLSKYEAISKEFDYISHQYNELNEGKLVEGEYEKLELEVGELENSGDIKSALHEVVSLLSIEETGVIDQLSTAVQKIRKISGVYSKARGIETRIEAASIDLKDLTDEIANSFEQLEFDPIQFEKVKTRLDLLNNLFVKYKKKNIGELIALRDELKQKVAVAVDGGFDLEKQKESLTILKNKILLKAEKLSASREKAFPGFEKSILNILTDLGMEHAAVSISNTKQELTSVGIDSLNLHFSANKNHPLQEVSKIASGGELSRLMLAIKTVLSGTVGMPTIILDEIDTGVSGEVADKVGNIIKQMGQGIQVINITHLPQVASKGDSHFLVYKDHEQAVTQTLIRKLNKEERVYEIAKMLSGEELTDAALENARVLLGK